MEYKKLKLEDLINKAGEKKGDKYVEIYIKRLDATIKAKEPDNTLILESIDILKENAHESDLHLVYNSIIEPNIKDSTLHEAYNVSRPLEILDEIFSLGEISNIAKTLLKNSGYEDNSVKLVEDIKN
ncbi:phage tail assembly chaperone [Candidatus Arthromitus sp. SFB-turkey]|uniref:phage tail assembly chaperone n=1 Tax=Candidatus Arthromitus sp. SFB-turkey TaxID=1840217 RepID=UPI0007F41DAD|nr:hypothetical protein [Candidatus Arthromitus sp. SFB-turkey]OAT88270.1 hypothetical protein A6P36_03990 [Candidatus Arthromitus sp. SFB-turkey]HJC99479.1 hypothetical protein [Candidatus Dwaynia gallinarum]